MLTVENLLAVEVGTARWAEKCFAVEVGMARSSMGVIGRASKSVTGTEAGWDVLLPAARPSAWATGVPRQDIARSQRAQYKKRFLVEMLEKVIASSRVLEIPDWAACY